MIIKDTLDRPLRNLRISVTDKCNFRCTYCMPEDVFGFQYKFLPRQKILTFEEIARLVKVFVRLGVRKIRLTGGESLLRQQLDKLVSAIAKIPGIDDLALTTNAYFLREKVGLLRQAGLQRLTVS
ncbi:MAG: radical SAM protein, partial [Calditrichaeota bacterium]|nr:radical SAM protein [Calditrichota bacterium]